MESRKYFVLMSPTISVFLFATVFNAGRVAAGPCDPVAMSADGNNKYVLFYDERLEENAAAELNAPDGAFIAKSASDFETLKAELIHDVEFVGTVAIYRCEPEVIQPRGIAEPQLPISPIDIYNPCDGGGSPPNPPQANATAVVYDQSTLDAWNAAGYQPAFLNGVLVDEPIAVQDAAFDIVFDITDETGGISSGRLRIRRSDGAAGVVSLTSARSTEPAEPSSKAGIRTSDAGEVSLMACSAGPWWQIGKACCYSQKTFCNLIHGLLPFLCTNCTTCFNKCYNCCGSNPCHSCDPCGLTWLLNLLGIGN